MPSPESSPNGRMFIPMGGDNSCGKSELAKQISIFLHNPEDERYEPTEVNVVHVGDLYRFFSSHPGGFHLDTPEQIQDSAAQAISHVHCAVDHETGEIFLKPNGFDRFVQNAENGHAGSKLGGNQDLTAFIHDFIFDLFQKYLPEDGIGIIEGRQDWGIQGPAIRVTAPFSVRREFFRQERKEAAHWDIDMVKVKIHERDGLDAPILAPFKARQKSIIDVIRVDNTERATKDVARRIGGIIFDYREGKNDVDFGLIPISG